MSRLPHRPRLSARAMLRQYRAGLFVVHDTRSHELIELDADQLTALLACDGTRDLGGVMLAAAREFAYRRASSIEGLLHDLARRGLLEDGIAPQFASEPAAERALTLEPLPGYRLRCDGHGACCASFGSIAFTAREAERALRAVPEAESVDRLFLPLYGSTYDGVSAVALEDGRCAFLAGDGRCSIHARAGGEHKPLGCRLYPRSFVDDGETVRVSVRLECPCVFTSIGSDEGEPLCEDRLAPGTHVITLAAAPLAGGRVAEPHAIRRWSDAVVAALPERADAFAVLWSLARSVEMHGLAGVDHANEPPDDAELAPLLAALARRTAARAESARAWRSPADRVRTLSEWLDRAARALARGAIPRTPHDAGDEAFYLRAILFGHQAAVMDQPLAAALRDLAVRVLLARAAALHAEGIDDPAVQHPLSAVETMMRAQGLGGWPQET